MLKKDENLEWVFNNGPQRCLACQVTKDSKGKVLLPNWVKLLEYPYTVAILADSEGRLANVVSLSTPDGETIVEETEWIIYENEKVRKMSNAEFTEKYQQTYSFMRIKLLTEPGYTPYCSTCSAVVRTKFDGKQFVARCCSWVSGFDPEFIEEYKKKWGL